MKKKVEDLTARIGKRVFELRRLADLTQSELAERAGLGEKYVGEIERGQRDVRLKTLQSLARALQVETCDLFNFTDEDVTVAQLRKRLQGRSAAFRTHVLSLLDEALLLVDLKE